MVLLLGIAVGVLSIAAVVAVQAADRARDDGARGGTGRVARDGRPGSLRARPDGGRERDGPEPADPELRRDDRAERRRARDGAQAYNATLPPVPAGPRERAHDAQGRAADRTGRQVRAWTFDGTRARAGRPVRQGQRVEVTLTNGGPMPHSIDFHAARIAPNMAFRDVNPGESSLPLQGRRPGRLHVPLRHDAGARPHRQRHVRRDRRRAGNAAAEADNEYVLVASEWYLNTGHRSSRPLDMTRPARCARLDDVQRLRRPVRDASADRDPGDTSRFWVVDAGPS